MKTCLLFLLLIAGVAFGQDSIIHIQPTRLVVKLAPLSLVPVYIKPSIRAGVEYRFKNPWSVYTELGTYFSVSKGFTGKLELKYNFSDYAYGKGTESEYVSAELYYKRQTYDTYDSIAPTDGDPGFPKTEYSVSKHVQCFTVKYGRMKVFPSGFVIDVYVGLGIRFKQATNTLSAEANANMPATSDFGPNLFINKAGNFIYPNFDAGLKIGWRIK